MPLTPLPAALAARLLEAPLTYPEVGQTAGVLPDGYQHVRASAVIGSGPQVFAGAAAAVLSWQVQLRSGFGVSSSEPTVRPGAVTLLSVGPGPLRLTAPCRVIYVVDEPDRQGFAYGTLAGHPESGDPIGR